ncbi:hypothetical protein BGZ94_010406 [Podila epigama]|nr:hypothetical protein BGZ94_010406 [Podila epigama]
MASTHVPSENLRLLCQLFDMGNTIHLQTLDPGEIVRIIGTVSLSRQETRPQQHQNQNQSQTLVMSDPHRLLCVAFRRATVEEAKVTIEGLDRCPQPKSA